MKRFLLTIVLAMCAPTLADDAPPSPSDQVVSLVEATLASGGIPARDDVEDKLAQIKALISAGARLDAPNRAGLVPLQMAAGSESLHAPRVLQLLLDHRAPIDAVDAKGRTALMLAAAKGREHNIRVLIANGATTALVDTNKFTALDHALQFSQRLPVSAPMVLMLTRGIVPGSPGADPNHVAADGWTPLMRACQFSTGATISTLITLGANINYVAPDGWTPITVAIASDDERFWREWLKAWAAREGVPQPVGDMPAAMFASWARGNAGSPERVWALLRIQPLDVEFHQAAIDRVLNGRDDPSAEAARVLLALADDLNTRPILMPIFGNDGAPIPEPE
jgi:hypothetical protein